MQSIVAPALQTLMKLQLLQTLRPDLMGVSKSELGIHVGLAERTLWHHIQWLVKVGFLLQQKAPGAVFAASVLKVTESGANALVGWIRTQRTEETQSRGARFGGLAGQNSPPEDWVQKSNKSPLLPPSLETPPINTPQYYPKARNFVARPTPVGVGDGAGERERASGRADASGRASASERAGARAGANASAQARAKLGPKLPANPPVFPSAGTITVAQLRINAENGIVSRKDQLHLRGLRRNAYRPWWNAYRRGVALRFRSEYLDRWCRELGKKASDWQYNPAMSANEHAETLWDKAAVNIIDLGCSVDLYLDVAIDTRPRNLKFPTLAMISSPKFKMTVQSWTEKQERQTELMVDGEAWDDVVARSADMGVI